MSSATDQWHIVDELFKRALDADPDERESFVRNAVGFSEDVKDEVCSLLKAVDGATILAEEGGAFSGQLWDEFAHEITHIVDRNPIKPGSVVGQYRVVREVGRGGMAIVFEAERDFGPIRQRYALKLIKRGTDTDEVVRRFGFERTILASLNHPNIARLYDGGVSEDGRPYFVMEFVAGRPITQYAREERLSVEQRLRLFMKAMEAVQYAHRNLVVHRDLKPSNILVTADGVPKLLDFGIAKVINERANEDGQNVRTRTGSFWLTPDYASPEQVRGHNVTTSSDVYGLGVVLYELLTGQRPFVVDQTDPMELRRLVCEVVPDKPSAAVTKALSGSGAAQSVRSASDPLVTDRLVRKLRGDLDVIVMKALRKEPERRYFSTEAMAADIRRFLEGRPLRARPDSLRYRVSKYVVRNAKIVVTSIAVLVLTFGSIFFHTSRVTRQRNIAQFEAEKSQQVATFMSGLLGAFGPNRSAQGTVRVNEILQEGIKSIEADPAIHPEVQAQVYVNIGDLYEDYAEYDKAIEVLKRARTLQDRVYDSLDPKVASTMALLGWTMHKNGVGRPAVEMLENALGRLRRPEEPAEERIAETLNMLGIVYMEDDESARALDSFEEALAIQRRVLPPGDPRLAETLGNLGYIYRRLDETTKAEQAFREALTIARAAYTEHTDLATALHGYGAFLVGQGHPEEGVTYLEQALQMRLRLFGEDHPQVADTRSNLGVVYKDLGRYDESLDQQLKALDINRKLFGKEHITVAHSLHLIGWLYYTKGDYDAAEPYLEEASRLYAQVYNPRHSYVGVAENKLGLIRTEQKDFANAEAAFRRALSIREEQYGPDYDDTLITLENLAMMYLEADRLAEAERTMRDVLTRRERATHPSQFRIGQAKRDLGAVLTAAGRYKEAEAALQEGFDLLRESRGLEDPYTQRAIERLIDLYQKTGNGARETSLRGLLVETPVPSSPIR
ncbi:MAG: tetratricopeptide repeat protein [Bacteroidetes bacterium]|nr:tetratricopeptide repeat protein [Bacteroidota bacterium]